MVLCVIATLQASAQTVYEIPFASTKNRVELTVENGSANSMGEIVVKVEDVPSWITVEPEQQSLVNPKGTGGGTVHFTFSVNRSAPVRQQSDLSFAISSQYGGRWTKKIHIAVAAPDRFELLQNFPNPFNPITTIEYVVPRESYVSLKLYNLLGEEVATLVQSRLAAGGWKATWDAVGSPSGVYFYLLQAHPIDGGQAGGFTQIRKLMVMK